jgi:lysozyme
MWKKFRIWLKIWKAKETIKDMKLNIAGIKLLHESEGLELKAYECPRSLQLSGSKKFWTIGYGNTFYEDGSKIKKKDVITKQRADELFENIVSEEFVKPVKKVLKVQLNDNQFSALISFTYNLGIGNFKSSTLLKKVNANPNDPAIEKEFGKWVKAGGKVLKGLVIRRAAEARLYFNT